LLKEHIQSHWCDLKPWFRSKVREYSPPFYSSVDIRDSGFKIVPVDHNLFPAGFNNICHNDQEASVPVFRRVIHETMEERELAFPDAILIIPEFHTSNRFYLENVYHLQTLLERTGTSVRIGWEFGTTEPQTLLTASGYSLHAIPMEVKNGKIHCGEFVPDLII